MNGLTQDIYETTHLYTFHGRQDSGGETYSILDCLHPLNLSPVGCLADPCGSGGSQNRCCDWNDRGNSHLLLQQVEPNEYLHDAGPEVMQWPQAVHNTLDVRTHQRYGGLRVLDSLEIKSSCLPTD